MSEISNRPKRHALMTMMTLNAAMTDELLDRLRAVLWSVDGEPNANGNVDETVCSEAADCIEALTAERDRLREALSILLEEYVSDVDPYRVAGFYRDPETEDCVVKARAALKGKTP